MKRAKQSNSFLIVNNSINSLFKARALLFELISRESKDKYLNHSLGSLWAYLNPLLFSGMYVYLFTYIFPARLGIEFDGPKSILYLLMGIILWNACTEIMSKAISVVNNSASLVKQVVFPIEVLPVQIVGTAALPFFVGLIVVLGIEAYALPQNLLMTAWMLPIALVFLLVFMIGVSLFLAAIGPFSTDLREIVSFFCSIGMFLAPVLYFPPTIDNLPDGLKALINFNPFTHFINVFRDAVFFGQIEHPVSWVVCLITAIVMAFIGFLTYGRAKQYFAEAI